MRKKRNLRRKRELTLLNYRENNLGNKGEQNMMNNRDRDKNFRRDKNLRGDYLKLKRDNLRRDNN